MNSIVAAVTLVLTAEGLAGTLRNGGFETGDFTGWTVSAPSYPTYLDFGSGIVTGAAPEGTATVANDPAQAAAGQHYSVLRVTDFGGPVRMPGTLRRLTVSQTVWLHAGAQVSGQASWNSGDYLTADRGWVSVLDASGSVLATPWLEQSGYMPPWVIPDPTPTNGWDVWTWTAQSFGAYTIELGVGSADDGLFGDVAFFDNIQANSVPDSVTTVSLLGPMVLLLSLLRLNPARAEKLKRGER